MNPSSELVRFARRALSGNAVLGQYRRPVVSKSVAAELHEWGLMQQRDDPIHEPVWYGIELYFGEPNYPWPNDKSVRARLQHIVDTEDQTP